MCNYMLCMNGYFVFVSVLVPTLKNKSLKDVIYILIQ